MYVIYICNVCWVLFIYAHRIWMQYSKRRATSIGQWTHLNFKCNHQWPVSQPASHPYEQQRGREVGKTKIKKKRSYSNRNSYQLERKRLCRDSAEEKKKLKFENGFLLLCAACGSLPLVRSLHLQEFSFLDFANRIAIHLSHSLFNHFRFSLHINRMKSFRIFLYFASFFYFFYSFKCVSMEPF